MGIDMNITKMSSKGQIVIPTEMRKDIQEGDKLVIIKTSKQIILKKVEDMDKIFKDDVIFAKRTEEALKRYEDGKFEEKSSDEFLKELEEW